MEDNFLFGRTHTGLSGSKRKRHPTNSTQLVNVPRYDTMTGTVQGITKKVMKKKKKVFTKKGAKSKLSKLQLLLKMKPEKKYIDVNYNWTTASASSICYEMTSLIIAGTTFSTRIGQAVQIVGLSYELSLIQPVDMQVALNTQNMPIPFRMDVNSVKSSDRLIRQAADFRDNTIISDFFYAPRRTNGSLFVTQATQVIDCDGSSGEVNLRSDYVPLDLLVKYVASTGAYGDVSQNQMWLCFYTGIETKYIGGGSTKTAIYPIANMRVRLYYYDE